MTTDTMGVDNAAAGLGASAAEAAMAADLVGVNVGAAGFSFGCVLAGCCGRINQYCF